METKTENGTETKKGMRGCEVYVAHSVPSRRCLTSMQLSDKYDRDRLGLPATAANLRTRERDSAPHLTPGTSKLAAQSPLGPGAARRADGREAPRRKLETSEDWRRGTSFSHIVDGSSF